MSDTRSVIDAHTQPASQPAGPHRRIRRQAGHTQEMQARRFLQLYTKRGGGGRVVCCYRYLQPSIQHIPSLSLSVCVSVSLCASALSASSMGSQLRVAVSLKMRWLWPMQRAAKPARHELRTQYRHSQ
mmetsp:Transcript_21054/g.51312  ORF Transcript_21054/g.51312 Transcript_21054/m.51312 type:complete len:128 (-) Transcript_21054:791-1174(-)